MMDNLAPVTIFIYKRKEKFKNLLINLRKIKPKKIFIVADGPKNKKEELLTEETRAVINYIDWDVDLRTNFSVSNLGGPIRIPSGLDWVFNHVETSIILEDDLVVHESFYYFATEMLQRYQNEEKVLSISATNNINLKNLKSDYFFSIIPHIWGWATWKRAWISRIRNLNEIDDNDFNQTIFNNINHKKYAERAIAMFKYQKYKRNIPNWDILWQFNSYYKNKLNIYYKNNLVEYNGNDKFASHQGQISTVFDKLPKAKKVNFPIGVNSEMIDNYDFLVKSYFRKGTLITFYKLIIKKFKFIFNNFLKLKMVKNSD